MTYLPFGFYDWCFCVNVSSVLLSIYLEVEFLGHMAPLTFNFGGAARLFSTVAAPFYVAARSVWGFSFPTSLPIPAVICLVDYSHLVGMKCCLIVVSIRISLRIKDVCCFMCLLTIWVSFLEKSLFKLFLHFKLSFYCWIIRVLYSEHEAFIRYMIYKYFCTFCGLSFHFFSAVLGFELRAYAC
jgi:hypothetical protein